MQMTLAQKGDAKDTMVKAYITYASNPNLPGYENGGEGWVAKFNQAVAEHLQLQEKALQQAAPAN